MKRTLLLAIALLSLAACGRSGRTVTQQPTPPNRTSATGSTSAYAEFDVGQDYFYFAHVESRQSRSQSRAGTNQIDCQAFLPSSGGYLHYELSFNLNTLNLGEPLTLFGQVQLLRKSPSTNPQEPLIGVWIGSRGDGKQTLREEFELQILPGKENYEFHMKKICSRI